MKLNFGRGKTQVNLEAQYVGADWCVHITGGKGHIGACAVGSVDSKSGRAFASLISIPGHKEGPWALKIAERFAKEIRRNCLVTVGIHLDGITQNEIESFRENVESVSRKFLIKFNRSNKEKRESL